MQNNNNNNNGNSNRGRKTIMEIVKEMPFICLNCDEKVHRLRDLARLGCHCLRPFYHFHCLASLPVNLCMKCSKRAYTLRGIKAIWDSFTHDEWKNAFNMEFLNTDDKPYLVEMMDSIHLDWKDTENQSLILNFLVYDYWKVFQLLDDSCEKLLLDRLEDALHIYPLEDNVIIGSKDGISPLKKKSYLKCHSDFLKNLWIASQGVVSFSLLNWIKQDPFRNQSIFFTGPIIYDILYGHKQKAKFKNTLIIQLLSLDDYNTKKLLKDLLFQISQNFTYSMCNPDLNHPDTDKIVKQFYISNISQNKLRLYIEGLSINVEIHLFKSNDIRKIHSNYNVIPYLGEGMIVSPSGLWVNIRWLYACKERIIICNDDKVNTNKINTNTNDIKDINTNTKDINTKDIIDTEPIDHGFLVLKNVSKLRRDFADPYIDYDDLEDDIDEKFIPDNCMRITINNLSLYLEKNRENNHNINQQDRKDLNHETGLDLHGCQDQCNFSYVNGFSQQSAIDDNKYLYNLSNTDCSEIIDRLLRKVTYNKKTNILNTLPDPYMPRRSLR